VRAAWSTNHRRGRDAGHVSNYLLENAGGYTFNLGRTIEYRGQRRRFGLGIERGPWSFYLTLLPDVMDDLRELTGGRYRGIADEREMLEALRKKRITEVPPLIAVANAKGLEPKGYELESADGCWFLRADQAGWPWRAHQSLRLLRDVLERLQGRER